LCYASSSNTSNPGALGATSSARIEALAFIHQFGPSLNEHTHFHLRLSDGVFEATSEGGIAFYEAAIPR
jgi:hypothetical protein